MKIIKTLNGLVEGYPGSNQVVTVFKGIPFAKPPVGELRWKSPQKVDNWDGILKAYEYSKIAWQPRFASEGGNTLAANEFYVREYERSEDCLYLNIFTPAKTLDEKLPVLVYVHGGGFETGYSYLNAYDGESFAKDGIIYVSISYRLNVFGFLATDELENESLSSSTGNYGIEDQIMALDWIKNNIEFFGGNPQDITVMGQSAGGMSVQCLIQNEISNKIFNKAIMQSGGGTIKGGELEHLELEEAKKIGKRFLNLLGVESIDKARELEPQIIIEKYKEFKDLEAKGLIFRPVLDKAVIKETSYSYFKSGKHPDIPYLLGSTSDEMRNRDRKFKKEQKIDFLKKRFEEKYLEKLFNEADNDLLDDKNFEDITGDEMRACAITFSENQKILGRKNTFLYLFEYVPPGAEEVGAHHSVEHHYVFQTLNRSFRKYTGEDYDLSLLLHQAWVNFIKKGNPSSESLKWNDYCDSDENLLLIKKNPEMTKVFASEKVKTLVNYSLE